MLRSKRNFIVSAFLVVAIIVGAFFIFGVIQKAQAVSRTWDGGGTDGTCGGGAGDGNKWSCAANWSGDVAPGASDIAVFDSTSTKNATIDSSISVAGIDINSGYTGTITQGTGFTVTVGSSNFDISAGSFTGSDSTIDINGTFTVSGGTFTATTGSLTVSGNFTVSSGTFNESTGTVSADGGGSVTWNVVTSETFNNLTFDKPGGYNIGISSGDTLVVNGTFNHTDGSMTAGTIDLRGNATIASTSDGGSTTTIDFGNDSLAQTITVNGGSTAVVRLNSAADASDSISFAAAATFGIDVTSGFSGTIPVSNPSDFTLTLSSWTQAAGTYDASAQTSWNIVDFDISGGSFTAPETTVAYSGNATWDVVTSQTFENFTVNKSSATLTIATGDTLIVTGTLTQSVGGMSGGTVDARGATLTFASTSGGTTTIIDFGNDALAQTATITGTVTPVFRFDSAADASDSLVISSAATIAGITTTSGFSGSIPITNPSNFTVTTNAWVQGAGTYDASAQTTWRIVDFDLTGGTFVAPDTTIAYNGNATWDVPTSQTFNNFTVSKASSTLTIASGDTLIVNGTFVHSVGGIATGTIDARGSTLTFEATANGGTGTIDFGNDALAQTATINGGTIPNIRVDSAADASDSIVMAAAATLNGITATSGFSGAIPLSNPSNFTLTIDQWTQDAGTYDASSQSAWNLRGFTRTAGSFTAPTLITNGGSGYTWNVPSTQTFNNVTITNGASGLILSSGDIIYVSGTLTYTSGQVQGSGGSAFEALGDVTITGDTALGTGGLRFGGSANQTFTLNSGFEGGFDGDITIDKTGGQVNMASALTLNASSQDLVTVEGKLDLNGFALTVNGTSGTFVVQDGGNFQLFGNETITLNASNPTLSTGSTVTYTGDGDAGADTYTVTTLKNTYHHLVINSTDGATDTFQLGTALDVNGNLTVSAGTFDVVSGQNYAITLAGNWANAGTFQARSGTVTLDGTDQTVSGTTTFNNFTKSVSAAAILTFEATKTQTFAGTMTLTGTGAGSRLSLRSSITDSQAIIDPQGSRSVQYLDVKDNNNNNATAVSCTVGCVNSNNNTNWNFPGIQVSVISGNTTEAGVTATFTVVLGSQPTNDVTIPASSNDTTEGTIAISQVVFTNGNWNTPQTVTVTGANDDVDDGDIAYSIVLSTATSADSSYNGLDPDDVAVTNTDDDTSGVTVSAISGNTTEVGGTAIFTMVLTSAPTGDVVIDSASNDSTEGIVTGGTTLTFTSLNWNTPQTVTVTGQDDDTNDGDIIFTIVTTLNTGSTNDALYDVINPSDVSVTNVDNEDPGITLSTVSGNTTEAGGTATFTIVLSSLPSDSVTVGLSSNDTSEGTIAIANVAFTTGDWNVPQTVTVTGQNDDVDDGDTVYLIVTAAATSNDADYNGLDPNDASLTNTDDDTAGVTVSAISGNTTEVGGTATFTMVLTSEPTGDVVIDSASGDSTEGLVTGGTALTFTSGNWDTPQTVTVTGQDDAVDDGDVVYSIATTMNTGSTADAVYDAIDPGDVSATNTDNDTAGVTVSTISGDTSETGDTATFTVVLGSQPTGNVVIDTASNDDTEGLVTGGSELTFTTGNWDTPQTVTVTGQNDAEVDGGIVYSIVVTTDTINTDDATYDAINPTDVSVTNTDDDVAPVDNGSGGGGASRPPTPPPSQDDEDNDNGDDASSTPEPEPELSGDQSEDDDQGSQSSQNSNNSSSASKPPAPPVTSPGEQTSGGSSGSDNDQSNNEDEDDGTQQRAPVAFLFLAGEDLALEQADGQVEVLPETLVTLEVTVNSEEQVKNVIATLGAKRYVLIPTLKLNVFSGLLPTPQADETWSAEAELASGEIISVPVLLDVKQPGLVYELIDGQESPVSGATVTVYYGSGADWLEKGSQSNPIVTGEDGNFSWYVHNGLYRLVAQKTGYQDTYLTVSVTDNILTGKLLLTPLEPVAGQTDNFSFSLPNLETVNKVAVPLSIAAGVGSLGLLTTFFNFWLYLQYLFTSPLLLFGRRRRRAYGVVYNSVTKVPIGLATVRLYSLPDRKLVKTTVTSQDGKYFLLAEPGQYQIEVIKRGFTFPSDYLGQVKTDGKFLDVYSGQELVVTEKTANVAANIPLDPSDAPEHHSVSRLVWQPILRFTQRLFSFSGTLLAITAFVFNPGAASALLAVVQVWILVVVLRLVKARRHKGWGIVYDKQTKKPISGALVRLFEPKYNKLIESTITDSRGRYSFLLGPNQYYASYSKAGYQDKLVQPIDITNPEPKPLTVNVNLERAPDATK